MEKWVRTNESSVEFELTQTRRKSIGIKITLEGKVLVTAPYFMSKEDIIRFVEAKASWIERKLDQVLKEQEEIHFLKHALLYLGQVYPLKAVHMEPGKKTEVKLCGNRFFFLSDNLEEEYIKSVMEAWYRKQTKEIIAVCLDRYRSKVGVKEKNVRIKTQKSRWGSCSSLRNLNFNWRLSMAPMEVIEYVVVHELCHLLHMNHSDKFWKEVQRVLPDYRRRRQWLKENSMILTRNIEELDLSSERERYGYSK